MDLIRDSYDWLISQGVQLVFLGSGTADLEASLRDMENRCGGRCGGTWGRWGLRWCAIKVQDGGHSEAGVVGNATLVSRLKDCRPGGKLEGHGGQVCKVEVWERAWTVVEIQGRRREGGGGC